jgi:2-polyprenyl-3-methyl-5-hydroxy-6-metoxy-1,4-benzoquinol methylase
LQPLARIGANVTGLDAAQSLIDAARSHAREDPSISDSITYVYGTIEEHVKKHKEFYDAVVASEVLDHVADTDLFLDACVTSLKVRRHIFVFVFVVVVEVIVIVIILLFFVVRDGGREGTTK